MCKVNLYICNLGDEKTMKVEKAFWCFIPIIPIYIQGVHVIFIFESSKW